MKHGIAIALFVFGVGCEAQLTDPDAGFRFDASSAQDAPFDAAILSDAASDAASPEDAGGFDSGDEFCAPVCEGRSCGGDSCGGSCGECESGLSCRDDGQCVEVDDGCTPSCLLRSCGDDRCGGTCGDCVSGTECGNHEWFDLPHLDLYLCEPAVRDFGASTVCPPDETAVGVEPGNIAADAQLLECGSNFPVNHRGMCAEPVSIVYQINIDCAPCIAYVNQVLGPLQQEFAAQGVQFYIVFDEPSECDDAGFFGAAAEGLRFLYQENHNITRIFGTGGRDSTMVMTEGNIFVDYSKKPEEETLRAQIMAGLAL
ncbi:MAG: hypothetical protein AB8H86_30635 [Polyangiales bacterium]